MPFGQKADLKSGVVVDFDQIYNEAIKPAIEECGLEALRGDDRGTWPMSCTCSTSRCPIRTGGDHVELLLRLALDRRNFRDRFLQNVLRIRDPARREAVYDGADFGKRERTAF